MNFTTKAASTCPPVDRPAARKTPVITASY
jgi:hypothetical protein